MKILLIGNYANNRQESMQRFAELLAEGLEAAGHDVRLVRPLAALGRFWRGEEGAGKWIGYIDRFILYPPVLRWQVRWADVVHICDQANAVYIPHLRGKPHLLTCHDMLAIRAASGVIAESPTGRTGRILQRWVLHNLRKAHSIACVSLKTRQDVLRIAGLASEQVTVIHNALNHSYSPMPAKEAARHLERLGVRRSHPFFLHVGGNDWYKNRIGLLWLFHELIKRRPYRNHFLLIAGKPLTSALRELGHRLGLRHRAIELAKVSNEELRALYSAADGLLFPSLEEGFGWPIIEAQACGCPVITSNRAPMTEIAGNAAIYVDPTDAKGAAADVYANWSKCEDLRMAGVANARLFNRQAMVNAYIAAYALAMDGSRVKPIGATSS